MENIKMWYHPKYYKELRTRNKLDQVISKQQATASSERSPGLGLRSYPLSGNGGKLDSLQTLADKAKAPSHKLQATSNKQQATESQASSSKPQAPSNKPQASSRKQQAAR